MYKIREATIEDFTVIALILGNPINSHLLIKQEELNKEYFEQIMNSKDKNMYLVEKSGNVVGYILFHILPAENKLYIDQFSILKDYQKKGIDEHLYQKVERFAKRQGIDKIESKVTTENPIVLTFFEEKGWKSTELDDVYIKNL